jgi:hypothetical protein
MYKLILIIAKVSYRPDAECGSNTGYMPFCAVNITFNTICTVLLPRIETKYQLVTEVEEEYLEPETRSE